jgi:hypothetical protein
MHMVPPVMSRYGCTNAVQETILLHSWTQLGAMLRIGVACGRALVTAESEGYLG